MKIAFLFLILGAIILTAPLTIFAADPPADTKCVPGQNGVSCPLPEGNFSGPSFFIDLINNVANWMFTFLLVLAVVFIILAAYKYMFSGGGEETASAHKMLIYAAVAVTVALLSRGFVYVIRQVVSGTVPPGASTPPPGDDSPPNTPVSYTVDGINYTVDRCPSGKSSGLGFGQGANVVWHGFNNATQVKDDIRYNDPPNAIVTSYFANDDTINNPIFVQVCDDDDGTLPIVKINGVALTRTGNYTTMRQVLEASASMIE